MTVAPPPSTRAQNVLAFLAVAVALWLGSSILVPVVMASVLAATLWPLVAWLHIRIRFPWFLACLVVLLGLLGIVVLLTIGFVEPIPHLLRTLPDVRQPQGQQELYAALRAQVQRFSPVPLGEEVLPTEAAHSRLFLYLKSTVEGPAVTNLLLRAAEYGNSWLWQWILILFILLFMLLEGRMLGRRLVAACAQDSASRDRAAATLSAMAQQVRIYLGWRTLINIVLAGLVGLVYSVLGLRHPWTWALLTAVLCYVPYFGPLIAGIPAGLDAFLTCATIWGVLGVVGFYVVLQVFEGYVVVPVVMGRSMDLNATTVMLACLFWQFIWGIPGLFLAMPVMAALRAICMHVPGWQPWADLMGSSEVDENPVP